MYRAFRAANEYEDGAASNIQLYFDDVNNIISSLEALDAICSLCCAAVLL